MDTSLLNKQEQKHEKIPDIFFGDVLFDNFNQNRTFL
jgi:hypothetical protein